MSRHDAMVEIENNKGKQFDPDLAGKFIIMIKEQGAGAQEAA